MRLVLPTLAIFSTLVVASASLPSRAQAQDSIVGPASAPGFGRRSSAAVSVENVFGVVSERALGFNEVYPKNNSLDSRGLFPGVLGTRIGLDWIGEHGVTFGTRLQMWWIAPSKDGVGGDGLLFLGIEPRVGYAHPFSDKVALWVRIGMTIYLPVSKSQPGYIVGVATDASLVFTPTKHFGVLLGPTFERSIVGHDEAKNADASYRAMGILLGLMADF